MEHIDIITYLQNPEICLYNTREWPFFGVKQGLNVEKSIVSQILTCTAQV